MLKDVAFYTFLFLDIKHEKSWFALRRKYIFCLFCFSLLRFCLLLFIESVAETLQGHQEKMYFSLYI